MAYNDRVRIEWGEAKRAANLRKHGVDFADAVGALLDPHNLTREDDHAGGEQRFVTLGRGYCERLLLVVWTERDEEVLRIISARKASPGEACAYED
ncbi:MAG: BrnT family toxin [Nevskia sp.]|nr:BrnT family toxin [Nevskia sp.]